MTEWYEEKIHRSARLKLSIDRPLHESRTEHQHLVIFENAVFGRVLALDDVTQTTEADEYAYHEMLVHPPLLAHGGARRVLIIGGGDGGALEEVLKHRTVERVTLVELDSRVIELSRRYLSSICGRAFDDPRLDLVIANGITFVETTERRFDVIIVDSTDPIGPGVALFQKPFYAGCKRCLSPGGVLVTQNGVPFMQANELALTMTSWRDLFADRTCYLTAVPSYFGGSMALGWASGEPALRATPRAVLAQRLAASEIVTRYYTPAVHEAAFQLPAFIQDLVTPERRA